MNNTLNFVSVIKECETAGGAGTKEMIKAALKKSDLVTQRLISEALNPYRVFGVRKFERKPESAYAFFVDGSPEAFFTVLDKLASRELTGKAAQNALASVLTEFTWETASYLERIIDKDLKCGFSADTYNKLFPDNKIPTFEVMLADKCDSTEEFEKLVTFPCLAEFKFDGERTIAVVKKDSVTYYSRSGKEAVHVNGLFDAELFRIRDYLGHDYVLDGERYASNFTETMNAKKEGNEEAKKNLRFRAFFMMPLADWVSQSTKITTEHNRYYLAEVLKQVEAEKVVLSDGREVADYQDMMSFCDEAIDIHKVEGLILKDWKSTYQWDRTHAWTKVKRMYDVDCKVVATYAGRPKSRLENVMGGISVVGFLESGERVEANVGSGFTDDDRTREDWIGRVVVIKYQEVSRAKNKAVASLRFPVYVRTRDDKIIEI
jgi:DNA ligase-1